MAHHHHHSHHHRPSVVDKQLMKIDEIFLNQKENEVKIIESRTSRHCNIHGSHRRGSVCSATKRDYVSSMADLSASKRASYGSMYNVGREAEMAKRKTRLANRNSIAHFGDLYSSKKNVYSSDRRRDSMPILNKPVRPMEHPSDFPSMLRTTSVSTVDLRRRPSITGRSTASKRSSLNLDDHPIHLPFAPSTGKLHSILKNKASSPSKDSEDSGEHELCDLTKRLSFDSGIVKQPSINRRNSNDSSYSSYSRRISIDSLDATRRNSRRFSDVSSMFGGDEDSVVGTGGGIDLDRIRVLNNNFSNSFGAESGKHEVIH